jgi:hypothetical protein
MNYENLDGNLDISVLQKLIVGDDFTIKPYEWFVKNFTNEQLKLFMLKEALYVLPTEELIDFLDNELGDNAIEIGSGRGFIGRELGMICTDSHLQERKDIVLQYTLMGQPVIKYPKHVRNMDAIKAVIALHPDTVLGCFVTHKWRNDTQDGNYWGVDFNNLLKRVKKLILVGNLNVHKNNPILQLPHKEIKLEGLITRAIDQDQNRILIWENTL